MDGVVSHRTREQALKALDELSKKDKAAALKVLKYIQLLEYLNRPLGGGVRWER